MILSISRKLAFRQSLIHYRHRSKRLKVNAAGFRRHLDPETRCVFDGIVFRRQRWPPGRHLSMESATFLKNRTARSLWDAVLSGGCPGYPAVCRASAGSKAELMLDPERIGLLQKDVPQGVLAGSWYTLYHAPKTGRCALKPTAWDLVSAPLSPHPHGFLHHAHPITDGLHSRRALDRGRRIFILS